MPFDPTHPDPEQLAALQAGELAGPDGVQIEAHVAGCAECTRLLAMAERGRAALTALPEVEPPAGLHHRLAAALERGLAVADGVQQPLASGNGVEERRLSAVADGDGRGEARRDVEPLPAREPAPVGERAGEPAHAGDGGRGGERAAGARPVPLAGRRRRDPQPRDRRLVALLSAAAAVILLVAGLVPLLRHTGGQTAATADRGATTAAPQALAGRTPGGAVPVFSAPGGYSASALRSALSSDPQARAAYQAASAERPSHARSSGAESANPQLGGGGTRDNSTAPGAASGGGTAAGKVSPAPAGLQQDACVTTARNQASDQSLRPAFFVDTVYQGRPATVLVTVRPGAPAQADLWAFPRGNCSAPPFAHEPVRVTPP